MKTKSKFFFLPTAGKITPSKLVGMSSDELASKELARWRQQESQHQLEMIQQIEKEKEKEGGKPLRKKTHKGEVEVQFNFRR